MYSGVAAPLSPASTDAASPGARWMRKKLSTTMPSTTGSASNRREPKYLQRRTAGYFSIHARSNA